MRVFFRVGSVVDNAVLSVKCGDTVLLTKKKRRMAPGEMESLEIPVSVLEKADGTLTVCVE